MKLKKVILIPIALVYYLVLSCDADNPGEAKNTTTLKAEIEYMANPAARYRVEFGKIQLADSLPRITDRSIGTISATSMFSDINMNELTGILKVWRLLPEGTQKLEIETTITAVKKGTISLLQLADDKPIFYFKPLYPPDGANRQTVIQFLYTNPNQPEEVKISILAIDYYSLVAAKNKLSEVPSRLKNIIAEFDLKRGEISNSVLADLDMYNGINNNLPAHFFYRVSNPVSGKIIQDYNINNKIIMETLESSRINPKYKFTLYEWGYQSPEMPFKRPHNIIVGENW